MRIRKFALNIQMWVIPRPHQLTLAPQLNYVIGIGMLERSKQCHTLGFVLGNVVLTIYHNPRCSKSRQALQLLSDAGHQPTVIEYLKTPLSRDELHDLMDAVGGVEQAIRTREADYKALNLKGADPERLIDAMVEHPKLMERPIVVSDKGAKVCRPPELVLELI